VVVIPGFMGTDLYLSEFRAWLRRIGYKSYVSGIGVNAECPNLLIQHRLMETIQEASKKTARKVHLIGHSLGGMIARAAANQAPDLVESVITLGTPINGITAHPSILRAAEAVRAEILERHGKGVLPACYTGRCTCAFADSLVIKFPKNVRQTSIYTKSDGIVDWRVCLTGKADVDCEVSATHIGLVFSPLVYSLIADRLAGKRGQDS
jgi:pimeloyl-ACP methyl ester carboxylesterase